MFALSYLIFAAIGAMLAYRYGRNTDKFSWTEYGALLAAPVLGTFALAYYLGPKPIYMFIVGMILLPILEWFTGLAYHKVLGSRLWQYRRLPLPGGYTSYLTLPIWGAGMVLLWLIARHL